MELRASLHLLGWSRGGPSRCLTSGALRVLLIVGEHKASSGQVGWPVDVACSPLRGGTLQFLANLRRNLGINVG